MVSAGSRDGWAICYHTETGQHLGSDSFVNAAEFASKVPRVVFEREAGDAAPLSAEFHHAGVASCAAVVFALDEEGLPTFLLPKFQT